MLNLSELSYNLILITEDGSQLDITGFATAIDWEENDGELAPRMNVTLYNATHEGNYISNIAKPNCILAIIATCGGQKQEAMRGRIVEWSVSDSNGSTTLSLIAYDEIYNLQKSQDNLFYTAGMSTQAIIQDILGKWEVPIKEYKGPNVTHEKLVYKTETLCEVLLEILEDAEEKGGAKCIIQAVEGQVRIVPRGDNNPVYHFSEDNTVKLSSKLSTADMVTKVKILSKEDDEGQSKVEAVLEGKTEFGIRQKIHVRGTDDSSETANTAAQKILDDDGDIKKDFSIEGPDVPFIRKGDRVHVTAGTMDGFFYVKAIRHNATNKSMSMDLETTD